MYIPARTDFTCSIVQALVYGQHVRRQLVHSVREEYEKTVREIEGCTSLESHVSWPRPGTLCYPVFSEPGEPLTHDQDRSLFSEQPQPPTEAPVTAMDDILSLTSLSSSSSADNTPNKNEDCTEDYTKESCEPEALSSSISPQAVSERVIERGDKPPPLLTAAAASIQDSTNGSEKCQHDLSEGRNVLLELLLNSEPLVADSFPRDKQSLLELRSQTAMELAWLRQAIASRQKASLHPITGLVSFFLSLCDIFLQYLQIKSQMMKTE